MHFNIPTWTLGGKQFWTDELIHGRWRIQRHAISGHYRLLDPANVRRAWGSWDTCLETWSLLKKEKKIAPLGKKVVIVDTPWSDRDAPGCLSRNQRDVRPCAIPRAMTTWGGVPVREEAAARVADAALLDFTRLLCDRTSCPVAADGMIRYRDDHHLTATFARALAPTLDRALQRVLAGR